MSQAKKWIVLIVQIIIAFISLYCITFLVGAIFYNLISSNPMDMNRTVSGIFLGFLVSSIPFLLIGWRMIKTNAKEINKLALLTVLTATVIEKIIPLSIAMLVSNSEPYFSSSFIVLSEEVPYFGFGYFYVFSSIILSFVFFYVGAFSGKLIHVVRR
jgi:hypothetical protein